VIDELAATGRERLQRGAHLRFGGLLNVSHVGQRYTERVSLDHALQVLYALIVGGDLRGNVGQIIGDAARWMAARSQQTCQRISVRRARIDELEIANQHALFTEILRKRRHRAGGNTADLGMVGSAGGEE